VTGAHETPVVFGMAFESVRAGLLRGADGRLVSLSCDVNCDITACAVIVSSVTSTRVIRDSTLTAVLMPCLDDCRCVCDDEPTDLILLAWTEPMVPCLVPVSALTLGCRLARLANMITVNMHEAKTRLSELVKAVEERNETVVLCRDGREVAEIRRRVKRRRARNLAPDPRFRVEFAPGYRPTEPLTEDEWPDLLR
jgi:antitoxin (DNA-binding transcriptional repressor) of toxin-antitoxin stability system